MTTELDIGFTLFERDFRAEDKNEKFDLENAKLTLTLCSPIVC